MLLCCCSVLGRGRKEGGSRTADAQGDERETERTEGQGESVRASAGRTKQAAQVNKQTSMLCCRVSCLLVPVLSLFVICFSFHRCMWIVLWMS